MKKILFASLFFISTWASAQQEGALESSDSNSKSLRKRTHSLNWDYHSGVAKVKNKTTNVDTEVTSGELSFGYLYNLGHFELGVSLSSSTSETDGQNDKSTSGAFSLDGEYNFIENRPGKDLIPFVSLSLGTLSTTNEGSADVDGRGYGLGVGVKWFPLSEIFALKAQLGFMSGKLEVDGSSNKVEFLSSNLRVGWALYF